MKNKRGFIATSLIYSFFLIFLTLFLGIIADHLQDKVLLNDIESSIKEELNTSIGINELRVGDYFILSDKSLNNPNINFFGIKKWVIASIRNSIVTLYSYDLGIYNPSSNEIEISKENNEKMIIKNCYGSCTALNYDNLMLDISNSYRNNTYINNILYNFNTTTAKNYNLLNNYYVNYNVSCSGNVCGNCDSSNIFSIREENSSYSNCISNGSVNPNYIRVRYRWKSNTGKIKVENGEYVIVETS